jgi:hypothetical protein
VKFALQAQGVIDLGWLPQLAMISLQAGVQYSEFLSDLDGTEVLGDIIAERKCLPMFFPWKLRI